MPFILIGRSYCWESKPAIISAALSDRDWLVSPSLWYGKERVYITLLALSLLPALTAVCLQRLSVPFHVCHTLTRKNESVQPRAHHLVPSSFCAHTSTASAAFHFVQAVLHVPWCLRCKMVSFKNQPLSWLTHITILHSCTTPSLHTLLLLAYFLSSILSSEALAFREVSLLAGVIGANSSPQWGAH